MRIKADVFSLVVFFVIYLNGLYAANAEPAADASATQPAEKPVEKPADKPLKGPKFLDLRYDEDFSYLDGPEGSYVKDFFDPIKRIRLGEDLYMSLGGEVRARLNSFTSTDFGTRPVTQDTNLEHRQLLHMDVRYGEKGKLIRFFLQGINAMIEDNDFPLTPLNENRFDFHQMFLDARFLGEDVPLTLRIGRQELSYGKQRLLSPLDWANARRRFDGVKLFWESEKFNVDAFYLRPFSTPTGGVDLAEKENRKPDDYREQQQFYGLYTTYKGIKNHGIDAYFFGLNDDGQLANANGRAGDVSIYTLGSRFFGKTGAWDYDTELSGQWGTWSGDNVQAWSWSGDTGWTFEKVPWAPRLGIGFDYASGDEDPTDTQHQTFNQMFPLGHAYFGFLDLIGRQNIMAQNVNLRMKPHKDVTFGLAWHTFWLDEERDAIYNAGGVPGRRARGGGIGQEIGHELDVTVQWLIDVHQTLLLGYSHFWDSDAIFGTGASEDPDYLYLSYSFKF